MDVRKCILSDTTIDLAHVKRQKNSFQSFILRTELLYGYNIETDVVVIEDVASL